MSEYSIESAFPIETDILRRTLKALRDAGTPVIRYFDTEEWTTPINDDAVLEHVGEVDISYLYTGPESFVLVILGNEWDVISDYTTNLEEALAPVFEYINENI